MVITKKTKTILTRILSALFSMKFDGNFSLYFEHFLNQNHHPVDQKYPIVSAFLDGYLDPIIAYYGV